MSALRPLPPHDPDLNPVPERARTAWTADELLAVSFPEPTWAVPGIVAEGVSVLAGPPKVGKSWLSLGLGVCIAAGLPALGTVPVQAGPVLYLALEDTPRRLQTRLRKILAGYHAPAALTLDTHCPSLPAGGDAYLAGWLDENPGARLVVIDVFTKVRGAPPPGTNSAYEADYAAVGRAKRLADTYGVPIVLVHHVRKAAAEDFLATVSGTNGLAGAADAVLVLERPRATANGVLHVTGRDVDEADYALSFDAGAGAWSLLDGPSDEYLMQDTRALISRYLREQPGAKPAQIAGALGLAPATVRQTCARMAADGQLRTEPGGRYYPPATDDRCDTPELSHLSLCHSTPSEQQEQE
ncbi:MAG TPA: AAA family ATPase [Pseudonocardiaceae bacterium]|nr:AAA family ATPase [Pseudonocardiaceae bacterium]